MRMQEYPVEVLDPHRAGSSSVSRNVTVSGRRTSLRLEPSMWEALGEVCRREGVSASELCSEIDRKRRRGSSLTAAVRVFLLVYFRQAATEQGHRAARRTA